jgi:hypothetical protein
MLMNHTLVLSNTVGGDVPAAAVAGGSLHVTAIAIKGAAVEKLFESIADIFSQVALVARQRQNGPAIVAVARIELLE